MLKRLVGKGLIFLSGLDTNFVEFCERNLQMENKISNPTRKWLISLINAMDEEIGLREEDKVLIILQLNTENKVDPI